MHLIISEDREEIARQLKNFPSGDACSRSLFYPDTFSEEAFFQEINTLPFLTQSKLVIVHQIDALSKQNLVSLEKVAEQPPPWISLILTASHLSAQSRLYKLISKKGKVTRTQNEKAWEKEKRLADWLVEQAALEKVLLSPQSATYLVKGVHESTLQTELEKLICFVGDRKEITLEDIRLLSTPAHHETLWQLGDALFARDIALSLKTGTILLRDGMAIFPLLAHLRSQFKTAIQILEAAAEGQLSQKFPYLKGRLAEKKLSLLKGYGANDLKQGVLLIYEAELKAKNGFDTSLALEMLLVRLCQSKFCELSA